MTPAERRKRRAVIVRRQTARAQAQSVRETGRRRRPVQTDDLDEVVGEDALLVDLPESLLG